METTRSSSRAESVAVHLLEARLTVSGKRSASYIVIDGRNTMGTRIFMQVCAAVMMTLGAQAHAETVVPTQGQTPEQIQKDTEACKSQAKSAYDQALAAANQTAATATAAASAPPPSGGRARGAATGAAAGAAAAQVRGNQYENYDKIDSDVQQEYRQNQAKEAAVAGAVVGGSQQRRDQRQQTQAQQAAPQQPATTPSQTADAASKQAFSTCMSGKGYTISP